MTSRQIEYEVRTATRARPHPEQLEPPPHRPAAAQAGDIAKAGLGLSCTVCISQGHGAHCQYHPDRVRRAECSAADAATTGAVVDASGKVVPAAQGLSDGKMVPGTRSHLGNRLKEGERERASPWAYALFPARRVAPALGHISKCERAHALCDVLIST